MVAGSNPTAGKGDIIVVVATAMEESPVCSHHEYRRSYDDSHPNFERYENGGGCHSDNWFSKMSCQKHIVGCG